MPQELNLRPVPPKRRSGLWRTLGLLLSGPVAAFGAKNIVEGAHTINKLADTIKAGPQPDRRVRTGDDRTLDLAAIAFLSGSTEIEVERQLANRRRQTTWATRCYLAGGCGFLLLWFWQALLSPAYASFSYVLGLLALCALHRSQLRRPATKGATECPRPKPSSRRGFSTSVFQQRSFTARENPSPRPLSRENQSPRDRACPSMRPAGDGMGSLPLPAVWRGDTTTTATSRSAEQAVTCPWKRAPRLA